MKKLICCLLVLSMLIPIYGCSENETGATDAGSGDTITNASGITFHSDYPYTTYEKPTFTPGMLESDLLTVQNGNYARTSRTTDGTFLEYGSGYYFLDGTVLYISDFADLTSWIPVCDNPDCKHIHGSSSCSAQTGYVYMNDEYRLFFIARPYNYKYLLGDIFVNGSLPMFMLVSMDLTGNDLKMEHIFEDSGRHASRSAGGSALTSTGYFAMVIDFETDGSTACRMYLADKNYGAKELNEFNSSVEGGRRYGVFGESIFKVAANDTTNYAWMHDGVLTEVDLGNTPTQGGFWEGDTLRFYRTNDGYYDMDVVTGEEVKIADAQVDDAAAWIIEPNCILETTLFESMDADQRASVRTHTMKLFDGQAWHDVTLPDDIASGRTRVEFQALTSDSIILRNPDGGSSNVTFYRIALEQETYTLEQIGRFTAG